MTRSISELKVYDPAEDLESVEAVAALMADAFESGDVDYAAHAIWIAARAEGMSQIADDTGPSREQCYRSFGDNGSPKLRSMLAVLKALRIELTVEAAG